MRDRLDGAATLSHSSFSPSLNCTVTDTACCCLPRSHVQVSFGVFESEEDAARQYDRALILEKVRPGVSLGMTVCVLVWLRPVQPPACPLRAAPLLPTHPLTHPPHSRCLKGPVCQDQLPHP